MGKAKFRSCRRRKPKFKGNQFTKAAAFHQEEPATEVNSGFADRPNINSEVDHGPELHTSLDTSGDSVSFSKLKDHHIDTEANNTSNIAGYRLLDMGIFESIIKLLCCPRCMQDSLLLDEVGTSGSSCQLKISCECGWYHEFWSSSKTKHGGFEINKRMVYGARSCGIGYCGLEKLHAILNLPPPLSRSNYDTTASSILVSVRDVANESMIAAANEISQLKGKNDDGIANCAVSCDGTWQRRGYSSLNGAYVAISMDMGKILDVEPMVRYCKICSTNELIKQSDPVKYQNVKVSHKCRTNFEGSAPNMETIGAKRVFERSIQKNSLRYSEFVGDGDSKGFSTVEKIYQGIQVKKLECIGHVQKRVENRLRKLKKTVKGLGGKGKLTNVIIDKLQNYYGIAVRSNVGNLEGMKAAIHASLFHVASSEKNQWHQHCPDGGDSWCSYKSDKVTGKKSYKPGSGLPLNVIAHLKPIYKDLSDDKLLERCLHGFTQNQNESFNGTIWKRLPKSTYVGNYQFQLGIYDAAACFNIGNMSTIKIFEKLGIDPGKYTKLGCNKLNVKRVKNAEKQMKMSSQSRRRQLRGKRKKKEDCNNDKEGKTYEAGGF